MRPLVLGSSSRYRAELLRRLTPHFEQVAAHIDESPRPGESPPDLAARLAREKAFAIGALRPDAVIIGSDQVAALGHRQLGKPGTHARACEQLAACSGREVTFYTGLCVLDGPSATSHAAMDVTRVRFRHLDAAEIDAYLRADQPYDCAGSFKAEALGISLFEYIRNDDPTALIGLPLIALSRLLRMLKSDAGAGAAPASF